MAILYPWAGRRSDISSGRSYQTVWGVNPTKDAYQQLVVEVIRTQPDKQGHELLTIEPTNVLAARSL